MSKMRFLFPVLVCHDERRFCWCMPKSGSLVLLADRRSLPLGLSEQGHGEEVVEVGTLLQALLGDEGELAGDLVVEATELLLAGDYRTDKQLVVHM